LATRPSQESDRSNHRDHDPVLGHRSTATPLRAWAPSRAHTQRDTIG
jgi:hypothetical protein